MNFPVIDIEPMKNRDGNKNAVAKEMAQACNESGFFYIKGHGVDAAIQERLEQLSRKFFDLPETTKNEIAMNKGGRGLAGVFPFGRRANFR